MRVLLVPPAGPVQLIEEDGQPDYTRLQGWVGGYIEVRQCTDTVHGYLNEDGKRLGLEPNLRATAVLHAQGMLSPFDTVVGPVVFLGSLDEHGQMDGEEHDLPVGWEAWFTEQVELLFGKVV